MKINCKYCKFAQGTEPIAKILNSNNFYVIREEEKFLIVPKKHHVTILDIPTKQGEELLKIMKEVSSYILDNKIADSFKIEMSNLEIEHAAKHASIQITPTNTL